MTTKASKVTRWSLPIRSFSAQRQGSGATLAIVAMIEQASNRINQDLLSSSCWWST